MSFLSAFTDAFTGAPAKKAAAQQRGFLDQTRTQGVSDIDAGYNTATGAIRGGTADAIARLLQGFSGATGAIGTGANSALGYLDQGNAGATGYLNDARGQYDPLANLGTKYGAGTNLLLDSYGVNGPEGNARATGAFQAGPGYNFQLDQGLDAINRRRNAGGMLASGNADRDAQTYGQGLANQEFGNWRSGLAGFVNPELAATSGAATGRAGIDVTGAGLASNLGTAKAGVAAGAGDALSQLLSQQGLSLAGAATGEGNTLAGLASGAAGQKVGLGTAIAQPYAKTYSDEAAAKMQGSGNIWNLALGAANLGAGIYGKKTGADAIARLLAGG